MMRTMAFIEDQHVQPNQRIVVVDDDPGIRELVSDFLGRHGFDVETAADGAGLGRALASKPADLVVLDVMLPGEDGLQISRRATDRL
jgi:two-component system OmpR family response regulator